MRFVKGRDMAAETYRAHRMACLEIRGNRRESYSVELPGLPAWISCRPLTPAAEGGDLHYLTVCGEGAISRVVLADVAGHGEIVSSAANMLRDTLRKHVKYGVISNCVSDWNVVSWNHETTHNIWCHFRV